MNRESIELVLKIYANRINNVRDIDTADPEALLALLTRDDIEDCWAELSQEQRSEVERLDNMLVERHEIVAEILPNPNFTDRRRWWWFLHEGPGVRDEAKKVA